MDTPEDEYLVKAHPIDDDNVGSTEWQVLSEAADQRLVALLLWLGNHMCHYVAGNDVVWNEEAVFYVGSTTIQHEPEWSADLIVFDVWAQQQLAVAFKLVSN